MEGKNKSVLTGAACLPLCGNLVFSTVNFASPLNCSSPNNGRADETFRRRSAATKRGSRGAAKGACRAERGETGEGCAEVMALVAICRARSPTDNSFQLASRGGEMEGWRRRVGAAEASGKAFTGGLWGIGKIQERYLGMEEEMEAYREGLDETEAASTEALRKGIRRTQRHGVRALQGSRGTWLKGLIELKSGNRRDAM